MKTENFWLLAKEKIEISIGFKSGKNIQGVTSVSLIDGTPPVYAASHKVKLRFRGKSRLISTITYFEASDVETVGD